MRAIESFFRCRFGRGIYRQELSLDQALADRLESLAVGGVCGHLAIEIPFQPELMIDVARVNRLVIDGGDDAVQGFSRGFAAPWRTRALAEDKPPARHHSPRQKRGQNVCPIPMKT